MTSSDWPVGKSKGAFRVFYFNFNLIKFNVYEYFACTMYVPEMHGDQERVLDSPELEL